jgi:hypothetical protein
LELVEAKFGAIGFDPDKGMEMNSKIAENRYQELKKNAGRSALLKLRQVMSLLRHEGWKSALRELLGGIIVKL